MPTNPIPRGPDRQGERSIDDLLPAAELCGESWARAGYDARALIREHSRYWPGGRAGKVRLILAALDGAQRAGWQP